VYIRSGILWANQQSHRVKPFRCSEFLAANPPEHV
jgi:hypothetical protein